MKASAENSIPYAIVVGPDKPGIVRHYSLEQDWLCRAHIDNFYLFVIDPKSAKPENLLPNLNVIAAFTRAEAYDICTRQLTEEFVFLSPRVDKYPTSGLMMPACTWKRAEFLCRTDSPSHSKCHTPVKALLIGTSKPQNDSPRLPPATFTPVVVDLWSIVEWKSQLFRIGAWQNDVWIHCDQAISNNAVEPNELIRFHDPNVPWDQFSSERLFEMGPYTRRLLLISHFCNYWRHKKYTLDEQASLTEQLLGASVPDGRNFRNDRCHALCDAPSISIAKREYRSLVTAAKRQKSAVMELDAEEWDGSRISLLLSPLCPDNFGERIRTAVGSPTWL